MKIRAIQKTRQQIARYSHDSKLIKYVFVYVAICRYCYVQPLSGLYKDLFVTVGFTHGYSH